MTCEPRNQLAQLSDARISMAIAPLSWVLIKERCDHMDRCALGGISADATLILSLVLHLVQAKLGEVM